MEKYICFKVENKKHVLTRRVMGLFNTLDDLNAYSTEQGFTEMKPIENQSNSFKADPMLYENNGKVIGGVALYAILYSDLEANVVENVVGESLEQDAEEDSEDELE
jgi:hypothetical protein